MASAATLWKDWRETRREEAFEAFVKPHLPSIVDLARRQGVAADEAEDVVQETLLELARTKSDEPVRVGVRPWLARRVRFRTKKAQRSFARRRRHERAARPPRKSEGSVEVRDEVESALALLCPPERQAVVLRYLHDMDYREIGYVLAVSENAARTRVHRGIGRLRRTLGGHAAALVAALGLPRVPGAALIAKPAAASSFAAGGGILLMGTTTKVAAAAIAGAALTAVGMMTFDGDTRSRRTDRRAAAPANAEAGGRETRGAFADMRITEEERAWMRDALEAERARRERAIIRPEDSGLDVLERRHEWGADVSDLVRDPERFLSRVRPAAGETLRIDATGDVTRPHRDPSTRTAGIVEFGAGTFILDSGWTLTRFDRDVPRLEIRGAGMDRTVLVLRRPELLRVDHRIEHLRIRDLTVRIRNRGGSLLGGDGQVAAALENVRFKAHATSMYLLGVQGGSYIGCRGCEFLGGYDALAYPVAGIVLSGTGIVTFERCLFADLSSTVSGRGLDAEKSVVHFEDCTWENATLLRDDFLHEGDPVFPVSVRGGTVHARGPALWGAGYAHAVERVTFREPVPRCRLSDLVRVVRSIEAELDAGRRLVGVQLIRVDRDPPEEFVAWIRNSEAYRKSAGNGAEEDEAWLVRLDARGVRVEGDIGDLKVPPMPGLPEGSGRTIGELVSRSGLDPSMEAYAVRGAMRRARTGERTPVLLVQRDPVRRSDVVALDAATGEELPD